MAKLIFKLRNVPDDEAEEVRQLLQQNEIDYFETSAGNWGVSMPALWLKEEERFAQARELLDEYQHQRSIRVRQEYALSRDKGELRTVRKALVENPFRFAAYAALISAVLFISLSFFLSF